MSPQPDLILRSGQLATSRQVAARTSLHRFETPRKGAALRMRQHRSHRRTSSWLPFTKTSHSTPAPKTSGPRCAISAPCISGWCRASCPTRKLDGDARIVTFANGTVARELLVDCDDARQRLVYAVVSERVKQHSASVQVFADGDARSRLVWIVDVLPNEIAPYMNAPDGSGARWRCRSKFRRNAA